METIFDKVGKKTPYIVPYNYFENISERLANDTILTMQPKGKSRMAILSITPKKMWYSSVVAIAAVTLCLFMLNPLAQNNAQEAYDTALNDYCNSITENDYEMEYNMLADVDVFLEYQYQ